MANFASFLCLFFAAFGPHTCQTQSIIMGQVYRLLADIDTMVENANSDATTYVTELQGLLDNLNTSASTDLASLSSSVNDLVTSVKLGVADVVANAYETDVSECIDLATSLILTANEILENATSCVGREIEQAEEEVALTLSYVNLQLITLDAFQTFTQNCVAQFDESEQTSSDVAQAFACVQPIHRSAQLLVLRFEFVVDIELAKDLSDGYETRVTACISTATSNLETLISTTQKIYEEISTCVTQKIAFES